VTVATGRAATAVERQGAGFAVTLAGGERVGAELVAIATPPRTAARLLAQVLPEAAGKIGEIAEATVESMGVVVRAEQVAGVPYSTFLIPRGPHGDIFHSVVTRDVVPDETWRGFVFHFQPGHREDEKLARVAALLGVTRGAIAHVSERRTVLPSPALGHHDIVAGLDAALASQRLAVTGNWFAGLAIEDCMLRSRAEWQRISGAAAPA
jgi:UDP-galactopyranose mutase